MFKKLIVSVLAFTLISAALIFGFGPRFVETKFNAVTPHEPYEISEEAKTLHQTLIAADLHSDTLLWDRDVLERSSYGHVDVPRLLEGKVAIQVFPTVTKSPNSQNLIRIKSPRC